MSELPKQLFRQPLSREFEFLGLFIWSFPSDYITITNIVLENLARRAAAFRSLSGAHLTAWDTPAARRGLRTSFHTAQPAYTAICSKC